MAVSEKQGFAGVSTGQQGFVRALFLLLTLAHPSSPLLTPGFASVKQEVYVTGTVGSFGGYSFTPTVKFTVKEPGIKELDPIMVNGLYNGEYPWIMRIYTDNLHLGGIAGAIHPPPPDGLVSEDGRFSIPIEVNCPNFGVGTWLRVPDLNEPDYTPYSLVADAKEKAAYSDLILMGIDPRNAAWVAGPDGVLGTADDNHLGDNTLPTPFSILLRVNVPPSGVQGNYTAYIYIEIVPAP